MTDTTRKNKFSIKRENDGSIITETNKRLEDGWNICTNTVL